MKCMIKWTIAPANRAAAARSFLEKGAPMPEGLTMVGRWHAPGSARGWLVADETRPGALAIHLAEWGDLLDFEVTPVLEDDAAGAALAKVYS